MGEAFSLSMSYQMGNCNVSDIYRSFWAITIACLSTTLQRFEPNHINNVYNFSWSSSIFTVKDRAWKTKICWITLQLCKFMWTGDIFSQLMTLNQNDSDITTLRSKFSYVNLIKNLKPSNNFLAYLYHSTIVSSKQKSYP